MNATTNTRRYRGYHIEPKRDFGASGYFSEGRWIKKGFVVTDGIICNMMPGGTWFYTVPEAKEAIDILIEVKGNADRFWEIMQPFEYTRIGQRADFEEGSVVCGRNRATIRGGKVVKLARVNRRGKLIHHGRTV